MKTILAAGPRAGFRRDRLHGFQGLAPIDSVPLLDLLGSGDASVPAWKHRRYHCSQSCGVVEIEDSGLITGSGYGSIWLPAFRPA